MVPSTPQATKAAKSWLKPEQVERMRDAAHEVSRYPERDDALVTLLYDTGLRRAEASALDLGMLDVDEQQLRIPTRIQKAYPNDRVPPPATFELDRSGDLRTIRTLRTYLRRREGGQHGALYVSERGTRLSPKSINERVKRLAAAAAVAPYQQGGRGDPEDVSAHTLRHSVAWRMMRAEEGNTLYDVRNRLRHASIQTTEREYDHFDTI